MKAIVFWKDSKGYGYGQPIDEFAAKAWASEMNAKYCAIDHMVVRDAVQLKQELVMAGVDRLKAHTLAEKVFKNA